MRGQLATALGIPRDAWAMLVTYMPGHSGGRLRHHYWRRRLRHLGAGCLIDVGAWFQNPQYISIGDHCWIDRHVVIMGGMSSQERETRCRRLKHFPGEPGVVSIGSHVHVGIGGILSGIEGGLHIGDRCGFSAGCRLYAFTHHYRSNAQRNRADVCFSPLVDPAHQCMISGPVELDENVGCALGAIILPGTKIGRNSFVQSGALLSGRTFPENSMIAGNPAKHAGNRFAVNNTAHR